MCATCVRLFNSKAKPSNFYIGTTKPQTVGSLEQRHGREVGPKGQSSEDTVDQDGSQRRKVKGAQNSHGNEREVLHLSVAVC